MYTVRRLLRGEDADTGGRNVFCVASSVQNKQETSEARLTHAATEDLATFIVLDDMFLVPLSSSPVLKARNVYPSPEVPARSIPQSA